MKSKNIEYIPALDHIRAFAAILIVLYHGLHLISHHLQLGKPFQFDHWPQTHNPLKAFAIEGHTAVALFLVLSGFLFTYGAEGKQIVYARYLANRFIRIFPLFIFMLVLGIYCNPEGYSLAGLVQTLGFQANLPGAVKGGTFTAMSWTISVEFQFYLIFPFLALFANKYGVKYLLSLIALMLTFRLIATLESQTVNARDFSYWTIIGRIDQFLLGMVAAKLLVRSPWAIRQLRYFMIPIVVCIIYLIYGFHLLGGWPQVSLYKVFWPTLEGTAWAVFLLAYLSWASSLPRMVSRALSYLGSISFSIYLTHFMVIALAIHFGFLIKLWDGALRNAVFTTGAVLVPIIVLISSATYYLIEKPFLNLRGRYFQALPAENGENALPGGTGLGPVSGGLLRHDCPPHPA